MWSNFLRLCRMRSIRAAPELSFSKVWLMNATTIGTDKTNKLAEQVWPTDKIRRERERERDRVNTLIHIQITLTWQPPQVLVAEKCKQPEWSKAAWILDRVSSSSEATAGILKGRKLCVSCLFFSLRKPTSERSESQSMLGVTFFDV